MKSASFILIALLLLIGGLILYHSLTYDKSMALASNSSISTINTFPTNTPSFTPTKSAIKAQVIKATYGPPFGFTPNDFTVKSGVPVRLEVYATENGRGCMGSLMVPDFSQQVKGFSKGETSVIEFMPTASGQYYITCAMGIPHATLTVK